MSGAVDLGFWVMFLIIAVPMFAAGWCMRGEIERDRQERRARRLHPSWDDRRWE